MSWPMVKLGDVAERVDYGLTASAIEKSDGPRFLRITDLQNDSVEWDEVPSCDCTPKEFEANKLAVGDIVFARTGATTGKSFLIRSLPKPSVFASYLIRVRPDASVDSGYLSHFFKSPIYWNQITNMANGAAQPGVNSSKLKELEIPLPPLAEQKRIAALLDKADAIRRKRQQAIQLADDFLRAVFLQMFGDPVTNPKGWEVAGFQHYCELNPKNPRLNEDLEVSFVPMQRVSEQSPLIDISDVKTYAEVKKGFTAFAEGDVLFAKITPCMENGKAGIARDLRNGYGYGSTEFHVLRPYKSHYAEFLYCLVHLEIFRKHAAGSFSGAVGHKRVPKDFFEKFALYKIPENLILKFSKIFIKTYSCISLCGDSFLEMNALFNSLSQRAFSGQL